MATTHGFWLGVGDNRVFDGVVTRHIVDHADIVAINAFYDSDDYAFSKIVGRLHAAGPGLRVLNYTWAGRKLQGGQTIGAAPTLDGMEDLTDLLLKDGAGEPIVHTAEGRTFILLDPRIAAARAWFTGRVSTVARDVRSDGVALDSAIRTPIFLRRVVDPASYPPAFDEMIQDVSEATGFAIFNGITRRPDQQGLLAFAHGASIEFFGLNDRIARSPTFDDDILPFLGAIGRHADKTFLVFGRASRNPAPYTTYDDDWRWQRYLYCAYLLVAGPNTRWKQHAGFLISPPGGRAGGLDVYRDALQDLGPARGRYTVNDGLYQRVFEGGLVLVVAPKSRRKIVEIRPPMFTLDGALVAGRITVSPGEGHVLLRGRPAPSRVLIRRFDPGNEPLWRWSALRSEFRRWFLHLDGTPAGEESEHDLALDLVRHRAPRGFLTLSYRTLDPAARVETVVEVDDSKRVMRFALVDGGLARGEESPRRPGLFRGVAPPASQFARLPVLGGGAAMIADGRWRSLTIDLDAACAASRRYEFRRAVFVRLLGSLDIRQVSLGSRRGASRARGSGKRRLKGARRAR